MSTAAGVVKVRDYDAIVRELRAGGDRAARMQQCVDVLWGHLAATGVSWVGFYSKLAGQEQMVLGARRDKPACSPIGLQGACGRCWSSQKSLVVTDVAKLGTGYIACDPRDKSEVVVPLFAPEGACWGVLDLDSYEVNSFAEADAAGLARVVRAAGLSSGEPRGVEVV